MTTSNIYEFIDGNRLQTPYLVLDLDVVGKNYKAFRQAMPTAAVYYAVKANPEPSILSLLASLGSSFDTASVAEIEMALAAGATPDRISFGNTIKKSTDIRRAFELGIKLFAVDSVEEVEKIATAAPGASVFCRILTDGEGAEWPLSRKFGCTPDMACDVLSCAVGLDLIPAGVSFHVGSQQTDLRAWDRAIGDAKSVFAEMRSRGVVLSLLNMGGGFPTRYLKDIPTAATYGSSISAYLSKHFGDNIPDVIIEPGRGMVGNAGTIVSEVVLVSRKAIDDRVGWVFLDIGKFGGLAETMDEAIRYKISTEKDGGETAEFVIAGPTCDSADVLYERTPYELPSDIQIGDLVRIENTGAYTTTYSAVAFNGFEPLRAHVVGTGRLTG